MKLEIALLIDKMSFQSHNLEIQTILRWLGHFYILNFPPCFIACYQSSAALLTPYNFHCETMDGKRATLKTMVLAGWTTTKAHNPLKEAYGDNALGKSQAFLYFKEHKEGRESIKSQTGHRRRR